MRYFTAEWCRGDMSDADFERARSSYQQHYAAILPSLPVTVRQVEALPLHDALIERVVFKADARLLTLDLLGGDLQVGYAAIQIAYAHAAVDDIAALAAIASDSESELLYDELDLLADGVLQHSIIFAPHHRSVTIHFRSLSMSQTPRPDRRRLEHRDRFVLRDATAV